MAKWKVVHSNTSIPVHLYTGVLKSIPVSSVYQSHQQASGIPVHLYTSHLENQSLKVTKKNTSIPVISIPVAAVTTLPLLMSAPFESSPLAAVVYVSSPLAAVVYESSPLAAVIFLDHICPSCPGVKLGLKDRYYTAWWKYQASRNL